MTVCCSTLSELGLQLMIDLLSLRDSSYWLVRTELLETLAEMDFRYEDFFWCFLSSSVLHVNSACHTPLINSIIWTTTSLYSYLSLRLVNFLERKTESLHKGDHHYTGVRVPISSFPELSLLWMYRRYLLLLFWSLTEGHLLFTFPLFRGCGFRKGSWVMWSSSYWEMMTPGYGTWQPLLSAGNLYMYCICHFILSIQVLTPLVLTWEHIRGGSLNPTHCEKTLHDIFNYFCRCLDKYSWVNYYKFRIWSCRITFSYVHTHVISG